MTVRYIARPAAAMALLCLAAAAQAQTAPPQSVEIYGLVGAYVGRTQLSGASASTVQVGGGGLTTSYFGIRGVEDLGGGNSVFFTLESFFQPDTGAQGRTAADPFFSRNAFVGINTAVGRFSAGRQTNPTYTNMQVVNPFVSSVAFSPLVVQSLVPAFNNTIIGDTVWNNTIQYTSPNLSGLTATVIYGLGEVAGQAGVANLGLHARYGNGPFTAVASVQRVRTPVPLLVSEQTAYLSGFNYDFKVVKVYAATVGTQTYGKRASSRAYELGVSVPVSSAGTVLAEWSRTARNATGIADTARNTGTIAYDYALSKRTDIYVLAMYDKRSDAASGKTGALGLRHTF
jgi:predicted porin